MNQRCLIPFPLVIPTRFSRCRAPNRLRKISVRGDIMLSIAVMMTELVRSLEFYRQLGMADSFITRGVKIAAC